MYCLNPKLWRGSLEPGTVFKGVTVRPSRGQGGHVLGAVDVTAIDVATRTIGAF